MRSSPLDWRRSSRSHGTSRLFRDGAGSSTPRPLKDRQAATICPPPPFAIWPASRFAGDFDRLPTVTFTRRSFSTRRTASIHRGGHIMIRTERARVSCICWTAASYIALLLLAPAGAEAQSRFSGIVVFGTSLSDSGNAFALVGDASTPPDFALSPLLIPSAPYAKGGHHFSNGATWVEQLARSAGL